MKKILIAVVIVGVLVFLALQSSKKSAKTSKKSSANSSTVNGSNSKDSSEECTFLFPLKGPRLNAKSAEVKEVLQPFKEDGKYVTEKVLLADGKTEIFYRQTTCNGFFSDLMLTPYNLAPGRDDWIRSAAEILKKDIFTGRGQHFVDQFFPYIENPDFFETPGVDSVSFHCRPNEAWNLPGVCTIGSKDGVLTISFAIDVPQPLRETIKETLQKGSN